MKHILQTALCIVLALPHCVPARGQAMSKAAIKIELDSEVKPSEWPAEPTPLQFNTMARPDVLFEGLEQKLTSNAFDPLAEGLLRVSTDVTLKLFHVADSRLERAITYRDDSGDNLIVHWGIDEPFGKGAVILWNTPYGWAYAMQLEGCRIGSEQELSAFLSGLVNWDNIPLVRRYAVALAAPDPRQSGFYGHNIAPIVDPADRFDIVGVVRGHAWFFAVRLGTAITYHRDGTWADVPERFPPLTELLKKWSFDQIRAQVGAPVGPRIPAELVGAADGELYFVPTANRDRILIAELARRGLTAEQVVELLTDVKPRHLAERLGVVGEALREAGKGPAPDSYVGQALNTYRRIGKPADAAVSSLYRTAGHKCTPPEETEALKDLRQGVFLEGPMTYLDMCSRSPESLRVLEQTPVPDSLLPDKTRHLEEIRKRLGILPKEKPENPVPNEDGPD